MSDFGVVPSDEQPDASELWAQVVALCEAENRRENPVFGAASLSLMRDVSRRGTLRLESDALWVGHNRGGKIFLQKKEKGLQLLLDEVVGGKGLIELRFEEVEVSELELPLELPTVDPVVVRALEPEIPAEPVVFGAGFGNYVVTDDNRFQFRAAEAVVDSPVRNSYSPLVFQGPPGSGKTHLMLQGIGERIQDRYPRLRIILHRGDGLVNEFVTACRDNTIDDFRKWI